MSQSTAVTGARGGSLTVLGSIATLGLQFVSVAVLSRLLTPEDFGLVAMVGVFIALGNLIRDFGMPMAALQAKTLTHQQASNLFWANTVLASVTAGLLALSAPLLVALYSESRLNALVPAMASVILVTGVGAQIQIDLARRMKFRALVISDLLAQVLALATATGLALYGAGYWALVAQAVVTAIATLVFRLAAGRWVPTRFRRGHDSQSLFRAGAEYGAAYLLTFLQTNADTLIVGSALGANALGYYNRGYQLLLAPVGRVLDPLTQVVVPTLNKARAEGRDTGALLLRVQFAVGCAVVWAFTISATTADRLVPLLLGPGWESTVRIFQILAIGGCIWVFSYISYWVFIVAEQSQQLLRYNLISKPLAVVCIALGAMFGIEGVAWGYVIAMALSWPLNLIWLAHTASLRSSEFAKNGLMILLAAAVAGTVTVAISGTIATSAPIISLLSSATIGTTVMLGLLLIFPSSRYHLVSSLQLAKLVLQENRSGDK